MNKEYIDLSNPMKPGWHWWKPTKDHPEVSILVTEVDIKSQRYKTFGGEWHHFPSFNEVMDYRQAYYDLYQRAKVNETNMRNIENALIAYHDFLKSVSTKTLTPKKEITSFLERMTQTSTPVPPSQ
jgi:hypothetical protein